MPLSEHEQRILEQLERDLISEDPKLATALRSEPRNSVGKVIVAVIGVVVGLLLLVLGVAQGALWLGVVAFLLMFGTVTYAFAFPSRLQAKAQTAGSQSRPSGRPSGSKPSNGSFMQRLEDRWDKRSRGE